MLCECCENSGKISAESMDECRRVCPRNVLTLCDDSAALVKLIAIFSINFPTIQDEEDPREENSASRLVCPLAPSSIALITQVSAESASVDLHCFGCLTSTEWSVQKTLLIGKHHGNKLPLCPLSSRCQEPVRDRRPWNPWSSEPAARCRSR